MKKSTKTAITIILIAVVLAGIGFGAFAIPYDGTPCTETWSYMDEFDMASDVTANFDINTSKHTNAGGEHEFVVLNLADVQLNSLNVGDIRASLAMLKNLIATVDPDLITLTGDQVSGSYTRAALRSLCNFLDSTGIPWAPVLGNHDGEHDITRNGNGDLYLSYKNCIFRKNAPELGVGNYLININRDGMPIHTMFMIDSHSSREFTNGDHYAYIWSSQLAWYEWAVEGIAKANCGNLVESSCYFHIPLVEYNDAWELLEAGEIEGAGDKGENVCASEYNNGFFDLIKELDSTHLVVAGHDHVNNYYADYQGVTLAYGMKSGYGSYWNDDMIGGTTITIGQEGTASLAYYYNINGSIVKK